mmetsp:Transcript_19041/g.24842  ORF Transcript_19041/g.24842 Transcript_19041/m.24842 type:complete len:125 (-) Transcript_19041:2182-2556(-)
MGQWRASCGRTRNYKQFRRNSEVCRGARAWSQHRRGSDYDAAREGLPVLVLWRDAYQQQLFNYDHLRRIGLSDDPHHSGRDALSVSLLNGEDQLVQHFLPVLDRSSSGRLLSLRHLHQLPPTRH